MNVRGRFVVLSLLLWRSWSERSKDWSVSGWYSQIYNTSEILTLADSWCNNTYYNWPKCVDKPTGYQCVCGAGFYWNTKICISDAVDSRLEFPEPTSGGSGEKTEFAYALLLNKPFPQLEAFTMSFYMKPSSKRGTKKQCIFAYKYKFEGLDYVFSLCIDKKVELTVHNQTAKANIKGNMNGVWTQLVIRWTSATGEFDIYYNHTKARVKGKAALAEGQHLESNGHMVLGQYSPDVYGLYDLSLGYVGSLAHANIWRKNFSDEQLDILQNDCTFTHCGDGVGWIDLRQGTRGISRLRWPSGIDTNHRCFGKQRSLNSCDKYCSYVIGIQCKEEVQESVTWFRTKANTSDGSVKVVKAPCPGTDSIGSISDGRMANRSCRSNAEKVGVWGQPQIDNCLSNFFLSFTSQVRSYMKHHGESFDDESVKKLLIKLKNHTHSWTYDNPVDISVTLTSLADLLRSQRMNMEKLLSRLNKAKPSTYYTDNLDKKEITYSDTVYIADLQLAVLNDLLAGRNDQGWNKTRPYGQEADEFLQLVNELVYVLALGLRYHTLTGAVVDPLYRNSGDNIDLKVQVTRKENFFGVVFPDASDAVTLGMANEPAMLTYDSKNVATSSEDYIGASAVRLNKFSRLLYVPKYRLDENLNSAVVSLRVYISTNGSVSVSNSTSVSIGFRYTNANNISNPECVAITHGNNSLNKAWGRRQQPCTILFNTSTDIKCKCRGDYFYAAITDMYNDNWQKESTVPDLMSIPSYLGCSISILLCICTLSMLAYVGTSSRTAIMHKHYAVAVMGNTTMFMVGITQTSNEAVCKAFAILFHYFFLAMFAWLMNEGFNVYVSITYTAHNQNTQESSGLWRYYIIGWGIPAVLVSAIIGASFDSYFSSNMCFVSWESIWLFTGPPLALIGVTLLVMIFAAKENNEVSYTKNESANAMTEYHSNAVWTQLILVTCTWSIAFLSLKFQSIVFKWVFFIFNSAQGAFLFVFFFLLNEEVRGVFKSKEIRQQLGWSPSAPMNEEDRDATIPLDTAQEETNPCNERRHSTEVIRHLGADELDTLTETSV